MTDNEILNENLRANNKYLREESMSDTKKIEYKFPCGECNKDIDWMKCVEHNVMFCEKTLAEHDKQVRADAIKEFAEWLVSCSMLCDSLGQNISDCYNGDNNKAIEDVLAEWQKQLKEQNK